MVKRTLSLVFLALLLGVLAAPAVHAQTVIGGQVVYNTEVQGGAVGVGVRLAQPVSVFDLRGDISWYLPDCPDGERCGFWDFVASGTLRLGRSLPVSPYLGAGVGVQNSNLGLTSEIDFPFSAIAGLEVSGLLPVTAYLEGAYRFSNDAEDALVFSIGALF